MQDTAGEEQGISRVQHFPRTVQAIDFVLRVGGTRSELVVEQGVLVLAATESCGFGTRGFLAAEKPFLLTVELQHDNVCCVGVILQGRHIGSGHV